jgi:diphthamide biosynthesis protein 2
MLTGRSKSCCVDEVAAQHVEADSTVHYGHACMSQYVINFLFFLCVGDALGSFGKICFRTSRLPVIYVFGKKKVGVEHCVTEFINSLRRGGVDFHSKGVLFRHDTVYSHQAGT